jgi:hypothetical protein
MFELPAGLHVVGNRAKPTPPLPARPSFRNRWDERQWEAAQAEAQKQSEALPAGMHFVDAKVPERPAEMPHFLLHTDYRPQMAPMLREGKVILVESAETRMKLVSEWRPGSTIDQNVLATSQRFQELHGVERDTLPPGLRIVG